MAFIIWKNSVKKLPMLLYGQVKMVTLCRYPHIIHLLHSAKVFNGMAGSYIIRSCFEPLLKRTLPLIIQHRQHDEANATGAQRETRTLTPKTSAFETDASTYSAIWAYKAFICSQIRSITGFVFHCTNSKAVGDYRYSTRSYHLVITKTALF